MIVRTVLTWVMPNCPRKVLLRITMNTSNNSYQNDCEKVNFGRRWQNIIQLLRAIKYHHIFYCLGCDHKHFTVGMFLIYICPTWYKEKPQLTLILSLCLCSRCELTEAGSWFLFLSSWQESTSLPDQVLLFSPEQWEKKERDVADLGLSMEPDHSRREGTKPWRQEAFPDPTV